MNKYNGDNIMVLWGAPLDVADHARKAVPCALEIQQWIVAEREKGGPDVSFGFGINTRPVVARFLGAMGRMAYTVIGDTANVASGTTLRPRPAPPAERPILSAAVARAH